MMPSGPITRGAIPRTMERGLRKMHAKSTSAFAKMPVATPTAMNFPASKKNKEGSVAGMKGVGGKKRLPSNRVPPKTPHGPQPKLPSNKIPPKMPGGY